MSINAMTNIAVASQTRRSAQGLLRARSAPQSGSAGTIDRALTLIVSYIPTEVVTTYVAVVAAVQDKTTPSRNGQWLALCIFLALCPLACWVLYAGKLQAQHLSLPLRPKAWPWWEIFTSTVAFLVWAYTLPSTPFSTFSWYKPALGTASLLLVSLVFGLVSPLIRNGDA